MGLLLDAYKRVGGASALISGEELRPFPTVDDRAAWEGISPALRDRHFQAAASGISSKPNLVPASLYMDYSRTGVRERYEKSAMVPLSALAMAECMEDEGRFLEAIVDQIWAMCERTSWVLPAHNYQADHSDPLPDPFRPYVDLTAGQVGADLAWVYYMLGSRLNGVSRHVVPRIVSELRRRITEPYLEHNDWWWMGFMERPPNNWNSWINANCLMVALLTESDEAVRAAMVEKILRSLDVFVDVYAEDGGCDEGPSYWSHAASMLAVGLEMLRLGTGGKVDLFSTPKIREMGRYFYRMYAGNGYFANFADATMQVNGNPARIRMFGERIGDSNLVAMASVVRQSSPLAMRFTVFDGLLECHDAASRISPEQDQVSLVRDAWIPSIQVLTAREQADSTDGFFLAAKGGHNAESHNHNDAGQCIVLADGRPLLIDVGVETYRRETFSHLRYEIWTMRSLWHNLPLVRGCEQLFGKQYCARDAECVTDAERAELSLDIAGAYGEEAGIKTWRRSCRLLRAAGRVEIVDSMELNEATQDVHLHWVFLPEPVIESPGRIVFRGEEQAGIVALYDADAFDARVEKKMIEDAKLQREWGDCVYRLVLDLKQPAASGEWMFAFERQSRKKG